MPFLLVRDVARYLQYPGLSDAISAGVLLDINTTLTQLLRTRVLERVSWQGVQLQADAFRLATEYGIPLEDGVQVALAETTNLPLLVAHDDMLADLIRLSELRLSFRVEHIRNVVQRILGN